MTVAIINNGGANMNSLVYALERLSVFSVLTEDPETIRRASHVILPGVGHASDSMQRLKKSSTHELIHTLEQPLLGICLGMQLMYEYSEEGTTDCLALFKGRVSRMDGSSERPAPHMGWNQINIGKPHPLLEGIEPEAYFYFVHGYTAEMTNHTIASSDYGYEFASIVSRDNFTGVQFHPERSGPAGARLLQNFVNSA